MCAPGRWVPRGKAFGVRTDQQMDNDLEERVTACLFGMAVGDALGLPTERLSRRRTRKWRAGGTRHAFLLGRGMLSDDTEHAFLVAQSLLEERASAPRFASRLARRLRWWACALPAGIGFATLRSCVKLWCGIPPNRSGVFSAGSAPAVRSPLIGVVFHDNTKRMAEFVRASTQISHSDPRAQTAALCAARLTALALEKNASDPVPIDEAVSCMRDSGPEDEEWQQIINPLETGLRQGLCVETFADSLGLERGISGYAYHTVPVAAYSWLRHYGDFGASLESVLCLGGDSDTVGALAGAFAGTTVGVAGIPREWVAGIWDWPISTRVLGEATRRLAVAARRPKQAKPVPFAWPAMPLRNIVFWSTVLAHCARRLLPPY